MLESFFFIELVLNFQQGFKNEEGIEIYDRKLIRKFYLNSTFCFDFLPILIDFLEFILEWFVDSSGNLKSLRLLRLISFLRLFKLVWGSRNRRIASAFSKDGEPNYYVLKFLHVFVFIIWILFLSYGITAIM